MKKLIELDAALSAIGEVPTYNDGMVFEALSHAQRDVELLPTVDAVPVVHGYWIKFGVSDKDGNQLYRCSVCKCEEIHSPLVKVNYCWNCGALMKWWEDGDHEQDKKS